MHELVSLFCVNLSPGLPKQFNYNSPQEKQEVSGTFDFYRCKKKRDSRESWFQLQEQHSTASLTESLAACLKTP